MHEGSGQPQELHQPAPADSTYELEVGESSTPAVSYTAEGRSTDQDAGEEEAVVVAEEGLEPQVYDADPNAQWGELLTPEREAAIKQQKAIDAQHDKAEAAAEADERAHQEAVKNWQTMSPRARLGALALSDLLGGTNFDPLTNTGLWMGGGSTPQARPSAAPRTRKSRRPAEPPASAAEPKAEPKAPEAAPTARPETSEEPAAPEHVSKERYTRAAQQLENALAAAKEGPFVTKTMVDFLNEKIALANKEPSDEGDELVRDLDSLSLTIADVKVDVQNRENRKATSADYKERLSALIKEAQANNDTAKLAGIQRRKALLWMISNRGSIDVGGLFDEAFVRQLQATA